MPSLVKNAVSICTSLGPTVSNLYLLPMEKGTATHSSILAWRIPMDRGDWQGTAKSGTRLSN